MSQPAEKFQNPGHFFAEEVLSGRLPANRLVELACHRYLDDWDNADDKGLVFREDCAWHAIEYQESLLHIKGSRRGRPFIQLPWQRFVTWNLYGWYRRYEPDPTDVDPPTAVRRFRSALILVPKKQGKTTWMAAQGVYLCHGDGEPLAEVYSGATTRDQAKIVWNIAGEMLKIHPQLKKEFRKNLSEIIFNNGAKFKPLAAKVNSADGVNPNGVLMDELHLHPDGKLSRVLMHSMAREAPLAIFISTAGDDIASYCYEQRCRGVRILEGQQEDETHFVYIVEPDPKDEWSDERTWRKLNHSLGSSFSMDSLRAAFTESQSTPNAQNEFKRYRLNYWAGSSEAFVDMEEWKKCKADFDEFFFRGKEVSLGVDLASTLDFNALVMTTKIDGIFYSIPYFWVPQRTAKARQHEDKIPYLDWSGMGLLNLIPGAKTEPELIAQFIIDHLIGELGVIVNRLDYDPWGSNEFIGALEESADFPCVECRQNFSKLNEPTKKLERIIYGNELRHNGHIILEWMAGNLVVTKDNHGNYKPIKEKSNAKKNDGMVALIHSLRAWIADGSEEESIYDKRMQAIRDMVAQGKEPPRFGLI